MVFVDVCQFCSVTMQNWQRYSFFYIKKNKDTISFVYARGSFGVLKNHTNNLFHPLRHLCKVNYA